VSTGAWTADSTWVAINATVSFAIAQPKLARYVDVYRLVEQALVFTLRDEVGRRSRDRALDGAPELSRELPARLSELVAQFGITVTGVDVTGIEVAEAPKPDFAYLRAPGFSVVLRGYDRARVDELLERARQVLTADRPEGVTALAYELSQPIPVRLRGYDRAQVDNLLGLLSRVLSS
jgi:SPFH domain / Band 7 family